MEYVPTQAVTDLVAERRRQVEAEGWTAGHDDEHGNGELGRAAACYAAGTPVFQEIRSGNNAASYRIAYRSLWPWSLNWWKPKERRRNLVRAGALIIAEIERLDRAAALGGQARKEG